MVNNILDEILSDDGLSSKDHSLSQHDQLSGEDQSLSDETSMLDVDADELRLDRDEDDRKLFVKDSEDSYNNYDNEFHEEEDISPIHTPPTEHKRVHFNDKKPNPWNFKRTISAELLKRLPENYNVKTWKRPPRKLVKSFLELLEIDAIRAVKEVTDQYKAECLLTLGDEEFAQLCTDKEQMLYNLIGKLKSRFKRTRIPGRVSEQALNIEYIYAKRNFIQRLYKAELTSAEQMEEQLNAELREVDYLAEQATKSTSNQLITQLASELHPSLIKAVSNSYGLIKDDKITRESYLIDKEELNLDL